MQIQEFLSMFSETIGTKKSWQSKCIQTVTKPALKMLLYCYSFFFSVKPHNDRQNAMHFAGFALYKQIHYLKGTFLHKPTK